MCVFKGGGFNLWKIITAADDSPRKSLIKRREKNVDWNSRRRGDEFGTSWSGWEKDKIVGQVETGNIHNDRREEATHKQHRVVVAMEE